MPPWAGPVLDALDGSRDLNGLMHIAHEHGADEPALRQLLNALSEAGVLDDATHGLEPLASLTREERDRIAPDVAALTLAHPQPGGAMAALQSRRTTSIVVDGLGRVGSAIAMLLTAAGVGTVVPRDGRPRQPSDAAPWEAATHHVGSRRDTTAAAAIDRIAPSTVTRLHRRQRHPDLVVLTDDRAHDLGLRTQLQRDGVPHLVAGVRENTGTLGPFVLPGISPCLACLDLHRADRDPAWPYLMVQLAASSSGDACDTVLAALVASQAALMVLRYVETGSVETGTTYTFETTDPIGTRRRWDP